MNKIASSAVLLLASLPLAANALVYEQALKCNASTPSDARTYVPGSVYVKATADAQSRFLSFIISFYQRPDFLVNYNLGFELKSVFYNYDNAEATGRGPAYVTAPGGFFYCNVPGCYQDTDLGSRRNSLGEYNEPQVAFGSYAPYASQLSTTAYTVAMRAISGRGNSSLMKMQYYATTQIGPLTPFGAFHCSDVAAIQMIRFQQGVYAPTCASWNINSGISVYPNGSPSSLTC
jgi:hypothetical protein